MNKLIKSLLTVSIIPFLFSCTKKETTSKRKDNKLYFGTYPQTLETSKKQIKKLNKYIINYPTSDNLNGWISYNYYIEDKIENYMFYKDIDLDNDNYYDYRGVYFIKYRPFHTHLVSEDSFSYQYQNGYETSKVYYFKYETIEWDILEESNNNITLISHNIIDSNDFFPSFSREAIDHDGVLAYANNYELSKVRKWLNNDFYNTSFKQDEKVKINKTLVKNKLESEAYSCNDTNDYVYLLSDDEIHKYFDEVESRLCYSSDYAKCQGLEQRGVDKCTWQLRTPYISNPNYTLILDQSGKIIHAEANSTYTGIRPVINIAF